MSLTRPIMVEGAPALKDQIVPKRPGRERLLRPYLCALALGVLACLGAEASAADWHHIHLTVPETKKAADWYGKLFGGEVTVTAGFDTAVFGKTLVRFRKGEAGIPGSEGSSVDHIGFSFSDLDAKMAEFRQAGAKVLAEPRQLGQLKFGFIEDLWGTKIEVMQDPDLLGFHHVHLHATDADATLQWYIDRFGGEAAKFGGFLPAVRYGDMWLIVQRSGTEKAGTDGRSIDHLGWNFSDHPAAVAKMKAEGIKFLVEPRHIEDHWIAFIEGPGGVKIEVYGQ